jgi:hypothetical protein
MCDHELDLCSGWQFLTEYVIFPAKNIAQGRGQRIVFFLRACGRMCSENVGALVVRRFLSADISVKAGASRANVWLGV